MSIFNLGETLLYFAFYLLWKVFIIVPMTFLWATENILSYSDNLFLDRIVFSQGNNLNSLYYIFALVAILIFVFILTSIYVRLGVNQNWRNTEKMKSAFKNTMITFATLFAIPVILFVVFLAFNSIVRTFDNNLSGYGINAFSRSMFLSIKPQNINEKTWLDGSLNGNFHTPNFDEWKGAGINMGSIVIMSIITFLLSYFIVKLIIQIGIIQFKTAFYIVSSPIIVIFTVNNDMSKLHYLKSRLLELSAKLFIILVLIKISFIINHVVINYLDTIVPNLAIRTSLKGFYLIAYFLSIFKFSNQLGMSFTFKKSIKNFKQISFVDLKNNFQNYFKTGVMTKGKLNVSS